MARRLREDATLREDVARLAPVVARLERQPAEAWDPSEPPPLVVGAPLPGTGARRWRPVLSLRPAVALAASLAFVASGVATGILLTRGSEPAPGRELAAKPLSASGQGRAILAEAGHRPRRARRPRARRGPPRRLPRAVAPRPTT